MAFGLGSLGLRCVLQLSSAKVDHYFGSWVLLGLFHLLRATCVTYTTCIFVSDTFVDLLDVGFGWAVRTVAASSV